MKIRLFAKTTIIFIILFCSQKQLISSSSEDTSYIWEGTIDVIEKEIGKPYKVGEKTTTWKLNIKWKEDRHVDVHDNDGNLIGQFVSLQDNGSSWEAEQTGSFIITTETSVSYEFFSGEGKGTGNVLYMGWIYYSLTDNDPLSSIIPNGTYYFLKNSFGDVSLNPVVRHVRGTSETTHTSIAMLSYFAGEMITGEYETKNPVKMSEIGSSFITYDKLAFDTQTRVISDETMSGHYDNSIPFNIPGGLERIQHICTWNLKRKIELTPIIEKADELWRPNGGSDAEPIEINAWIDKDKDLEGKWRFTLYDISKEKGYCMNAGDETNADLKFAEGQEGFIIIEETDEKIVMESTETMNETNVVIKPFDYGAWGRLKAEVYVEGEKYDAETEDGEDNITIPRDEDEDRIADYWEEDAGVKEESAEADNDSKPELTGIEREPGDGFSNYEEYRGFKMKGEWKDTDPQYKDIFVYDEIGYDCGYFYNTGLEIHLIDEDEYEQRVVNFNRGYGTITTQNGQKGLYLTEKNLGGYQSGSIVAGRVEEVGTPNVVDWVGINSIIIDEYEKYCTEEGYRKHLEQLGFFPFRIEKIMAKWRENYENSSMGELLSGNTFVTIAHELGHAVNIPHHATFGIEGQEDVLESARGHPVAVQGGIWSGDVSCVMRYDYADEYLGSDGNFYRYPKRKVDISAATTYCTEKAGTGINAGGRIAGDATEGRCIKRITLKGYFRDGN